MVAGPAERKKLTINIEKGEDDIDQISARIQGFKNQIKNLQRQTREMTVEMRRMNQEMKAGGVPPAMRDAMVEPFRKQKEEIGSLIEGKKANLEVSQDQLQNQRRSVGAMKRQNKEMRRFKGEYLSLMFAGMGLNSVFGGYISKVTEMLGITKIISTLFTVLLIPVLKPFVRVLANILKWFTQLPEETKRLIGSLLVAITVFGTLLMVLGMAALAFEGFLSVLESLVPEKALNNVEILSVSLGEMPGEILNSILALGGLGAVGVTSAGAIGVLTAAIASLSRSYDDSSKSTDDFGNTLNASLGDGLGTVIQLFRDLWSVVTGEKNLKDVIGEFLESMFGKEATDKIFKFIDQLVKTINEALESVEKDIDTMWNDIKTSVGNRLTIIYGELQVFFIEFMAWLYVKLYILYGELQVFFIEFMAWLYKEWVSLSRQLSSILQSEFRSALDNMRIDLDNWTARLPGVALLNSLGGIGGSSQTNNLTVNNSVSSNVDINRIADEVGRALSNSWRSIT